MHIKAVPSIRAAFLCALVGAAWAARMNSADPLERLDTSVNELIPHDARVEAVATASDFKWLEGPVWIRDGRYLLFAEIPSNSIRKWSPGGPVTTFLQPSGYLGPQAYGGKEPGSNGMTLDSKGRLTVAGHAQRDVYRLESMDPHGQITVLANTYKGKKLNSPNDLVYKSDGSLYFTDPPYGLRTQNEKDPEKELGWSGVYRLENARNHAAGAAPDPGKLTLLVSNLPRPNGIAFSPDEKYLYVNNSEPKKIWMRYEVESDGTLKRGTLFADASSDPRPGAPDGMKLDTKGNIYSAGPGGVWILSPSGKHLGTLAVPERVGNLAWGDDGMSLYIMASTHIYRVRTTAKGILP